MATPTTLPAAFTAGQILTAAQQNALRGAFRVLQVVSTSKVDTFTSSSTSYADITGLSVSITPSSTSSKIFVMAQIAGSMDVGAASVAFQLVRDSTAINVGTAAGSRTSATISFSNTIATEATSGNISFLDSPATTSATIYKIQGKNLAAGTFFINRTDSDTDASFSVRTASSITVMEISA
jgi:hypothetical protein